MHFKPIVIAALALAAATAGGLAQAHDGRVGVSINLPLPPLPPLPGLRFLFPPAVVVSAPQPVYGYGVRRDSDRDGIPDRYDRVYNPGWDRDGDGVPNRYDRYDNRRGGHWEQHVDNRHDRRDDRRDDRHDRRDDRRDDRHDGRNAPQGWR